MKKSIKETAAAMLGCLMLVAGAGSDGVLKYRNEFNLDRFVAVLSDQGAGADEAFLGSPMVALTGIKKVIYGA